MPKKLRRYIQKVRKNITKIDSSTFKLSLAVAGFAKEELSITETDGLLSIKGAKKGDKNSKFLYHGIAERDGG